MGLRQTASQEITMKLHQRFQYGIEVEEDQIQKYEQKSVLGIVAKIN